MKNKSLEVVISTLQYLVHKEPSKRLWISSSEQIDDIAIKVLTALSDNRLLLEWVVDRFPNHGDEVLFVFDPDMPDMIPESIEARTIHLGVYKDGYFMDREGANYGEDCAWMPKPLLP